MKKPSNCGARETKDVSTIADISKIIIRKANLQDSLQIGKVLHSSYNISSRGEGSWAFRNEYRKGATYLVAKYKGKIIGATSCIIHGLPKHGLAELDRIAVVPEYRGRGIGNLLFRGLIMYLQKYYRKNSSRLRKLYLFTHADNLTARKFYRNLGFKYETSLKSHYYKGRTEFVLSMFFR